MNIEQLREEIEIDEGCVDQIYLDHLGFPTFGIGHLITDSDPEFGEDIGTKISRDRIIEAFNADIEIVLGDCRKLYDDFDELPEEVQLIVANMLFNMGYPRLSKFKGMKAGVDARDWNKAADEMVDSRWYNQVTNRAQRLVDRMRALA
jgi:lysozyme